MNRLSRRVAAHHKTAEQQLLDAADASAAHVDREIAGLWQDLLAVIATKADYNTTYQRSLSILRRIPPTITQSLHGSFTDLFWKGRNTAVRAVTESVPKGKMREVVIERAAQKGFAHWGESRSIPVAAGVRVQFTDALAPLRPVGRFLEDVSTEFSDLLDPLRVGDMTDEQLLAYFQAFLNGQSISGIFDYFVNALKGIETSDQITASINRSISQGMSKKQIVEEVLLPKIPKKILMQTYFETLLFKPPSQKRVSDLMDYFVRPWGIGALGDQDKRMPEDLAAGIARGMSQGLNQQEIAKEILPYVDGSRVRARRAARTFGMYVAHQGQENAHEGMRDLIVGYQVHAVYPLDKNVRPEHRERNLRQYYYDPAPGQHGMNECPHPPLEADGTVAFNCRCQIIPILVV